MWEEKFGFETITSVSSIKSPLFESLKVPSLYALRIKILQEFFIYSK